jgi:hypothetical protein
VNQNFKTKKLARNTKKVIVVIITPTLFYLFIYLFLVYLESVYRYSVFRNIRLNIPDNNISSSCFAPDDPKCPYNGLYCFIFCFLKRRNES